MMETIGEITLGKQPPCDVEAEKALLGSVLLLPDRFDDARAEVKADDFYDDANRSIFVAMMAMHADGQPIDSTLLAGTLKQAGDWERVGGVDYLYELGQAVPTGASLVHYARIVRETSRKRRMLKVGLDLIHGANNGTTASKLVTMARNGVMGRVKASHGWAR